MNFSRQRMSPISAGEIINYKNVDLLPSPYFRIFTISL